MLLQSNPALRTVFLVPGESKPLIKDHILNSLSSPAQYGHPVITDSFLGTWGK